MMEINYEPYFARTSIGVPDLRVELGIELTAPQDGTRSSSLPPAIMVLRPAAEARGVSTSSGRLLGFTRKHSSSTAPHTGRERDWVDSFRAALSAWTTAVDTEDSEPSDSDEAIDSLLAEVGVEAFIPLYDLVIEGPPLTPQEFRTFFRALGRSTSPIVVLYRDPLIKAGLRQNSSISRDAAAMAIYDSRQTTLLPALQAARAIESNPAVRRTMTDILRILG